MVLCPIDPKPCPTVRYNPRQGALPVWTVIAERQKQCAQSWWLVAQPDHARLSGDLAAKFVSPLFPKVSPDIALAIAFHDAGWETFPSERDPAAPPMISDDFKPRSFIEFAPHDFFPAWTQSIERAQQICAEGGVMVSRHFEALAQFRLKQQIDGPAEETLVRDFVNREAARQQRLCADARITQQRSDELLKLLQLCDLLSLYLCCGAQDDVELPRSFGGRSIQITREDSISVLSPSPFGADGPADEPIEFRVAARTYPEAKEQSSATELVFHLR